MIRSLRAAALALISTLPLALAPLPAAAVHIERVTSPTGIEAWLVEDHANPIVSVRFAFRGGAALDPAGREGLADMVSSLLDEGAGEMAAQAFQKRLEEMAVELRFDMGFDVFGGSMRVLTEYSEEALGMLRLALTAPRFDDDAVERVRGQLLANLRRQAEQPSTAAFHTLQEAFFPGHPYGRRASGTADSLAAITRDDLKRFVGERFARDNLVIGVVGNITPEALKSLLDATFGPLPPRATPWTVADTAPAATGGTILLRRPVPQSAILFGQEGLKRDHPDFYAATVLNHILGGGTFTSRLFDEVREKRGLAYSIDTYLYPMDHAALLLGNAGTANGRAEETIAVVRDTWRRMAEEGVTADEVDAAKDYLTGSFALRFDSSNRVAGILATMRLDGLGIDYLERRNALIQAVTAEDVGRLARTLLDPAKLTVVVVGDPPPPPAPPPPAKPVEKAQPKAPDPAPAKPAEPAKAAAPAKNPAPAQGQSREPSRR